MVGDRFGSTGLKTKIGLGVGAGLGLIGLSFSAKDDTYNTIEGLHHGGMAQGIRRSHTDFGSGYRGLPDALMGVTLDREILDYRKDVIESGAYKDVERDIAARQKEQLGNLGSFGKRDFERSKSENMSGLVASQGSLRNVRLDNFNMQVEDADTLILKRKGLMNLFADPIQIRLAGIDAPETTGHSGDPLENVRYRQAQLGGEQASDVLRSLIDRQDDLSLKIGTEKTYGRYVGALIGDNSVLNVDLARTGAVTALPFGKATKDVVSRGAVESAQSEAQAGGRGVWGSARYQAIDIVQETVGQPITFNTLSRIDKLAKNLNLAAYSSFIEGMGSEDRSLTSKEEDTANRIGRALRKTHGPKKRAYNKFEGLHPGSEGMGAQSIRKHSEFGSGWRGLFGLDKEGIAKIGAETYEEYQSQKVSKASDRMSKALGREISPGVEKKWVGRTRGARIYNYISSKDDDYNTIEALRHDGIAQHIRKSLTEFGSGWNPLRKIAKEVFGESGGSFKKMIGDPKFKSALSKAEELGQIGEGATGGVYKMKATYEGKTFHFAEKRGLVPEKEIRAMQAASHEITPDVYETGFGKVSMELFEGRSIMAEDFVNNPALVGKVEEAYSKLHETGWLQKDTHFGNIMLTKGQKGKQEIGLVDFGAAQHKSEMDAIDFLTESEFERTAASGTKSMFGGGIMSTPKASEVVDEIDFDDILGGLSEPKQALGRNQRFAEVAQDSVGAGFRAAKNAKGSGGFASTKKYN